MKRLIKWIIPILLVALLIGSACWYMLVYDRSTVQDFLNAQARRSARDGHFETATRFYNLSYRLAGKDQTAASAAIEMARIYRAAGNYTKAEAVLTNAIADAPSVELYVALAQTFALQDKLLDVVNMLDNVSDPQVRAELDAMRPAVPTVDFEPGFYSQYVTLTFDLPEDGTLYVTTDGEYPTIAREPSTGTVELGGGETKIYALSVADNGLVSPLAIFNYTVGGVIEDVTFADPAMDALAREMLLFGADTVIRTDDLWTIKELEVPAEAATLEDLKYFTYLEKLTIAGRDVPDLSFLNGMVKLHTLTVTDCHVAASLAPIGNLPALTDLTLSGCSLSSLSELSAATGLTVLDVSRNAIGDIDLLADMTRLEQVNLADNAVKSLTPLSGLVGLTWLDISQNAITTLSPIASCTGLTGLDLSENSVANLDALSGMTALTVLDASENSLTDVSALAGCTALEDVNLSGNAITDVSALSGISTIWNLDLSHNQIAALPAFGAGSRLAKLSAGTNKLTSLASLEGLENLNQVFVDYNPELADISPLYACHNLTQLDAYGTKVTSAQAKKLLDSNVIVNYDPTAADAAAKKEE